MVVGAIAAAIAANLMGAVFYSPYVLGKPWMEATFPRAKWETFAQESGSAYAVTLVSSSCTAFVLRFVLVNFFKMAEVMDAVKFVFGLASLSTLLDLPHLAFSQRNIIAFLIDHLYDMITLVCMALCIFYMSDY